MLPPKADRIIDLGYAFRASKVLLSAVELGVFTALAAKPLDLASLRQKVGVAERGAWDFFDALVALRMLDRSADGYYANTPEADFYLDADKPTYIGGDLAHLNAQLYAQWNNLTASLKTGNPQTGSSIAGNFSKMYGDPKTLETFAAAMTGGTLPAAMAIATRFPWDTYERLIDIGTAQGCLPTLRGQATSLHSWWRLRPCSTSTAVRALCGKARCRGSAAVLRRQLLRRSISGHRCVGARARAAQLGY